MSDFGKKQELKLIKALSYKVMASLIQNLNDDQLDDLIFDTFVTELDKNERMKILLTIRKFAVNFDQRGCEIIKQLYN